MQRICSTHFIIALKLTDYVYEICNIYSENALWSRTVLSLCLFNSQILFAYLTKLQHLTFLFVSNICFSFFGSENINNHYAFLRYNFVDRSVKGVTVLSKWVIWFKTMIIKSYKLFIRDSFLSDTIFLNNKISVKTNFSICDIIGQLLYSIFLMNISLRMREITNFPSGPK